MRIIDADPTQVHTEYGSPVYWVTLWFSEGSGQWFARTVSISDAYDVTEVLDFAATSGATRSVVAVTTRGDPHGRIILAGADPTEGTQIAM